jgi:hypothetical protein
LWQLGSVACVGWDWDAVLTSTAHLLCCVVLCSVLYCALSRAPSIDLQQKEKKDKSAKKEKVCLHELLVAVMHAGLRAGLCAGLRVGLYAYLLACLHACLAHILCLWPYQQLGWLDRSHHYISPVLSCRAVLCCAVM